MLDHRNEEQERRDEVLRRLLQTPPDPKGGKPKYKEKPSKDDPGR